MNESLYGTKRKTDRFGNLLRRDNIDQFAASYDAVEVNKNIAQDLLDYVMDGREGKSFRFYGKTNGVENTLVVKKISQMDRMIFVTKAGTEVELVPGGSGLQIVNKRTRRVILDKGNDLIIETLLSFSEFLFEGAYTTELTDDVLVVIKNKNGGFAKRHDGVQLEDIVIALRKKYPTTPRDQMTRKIDDALDFWSGSGEIMQDINGYWKPAYAI